MMMRFILDILVHTDPSFREQKNGGFFCNRGKRSDVPADTDHCFASWHKLVSSDDFLAKRNVSYSDDMVIYIRIMISRGLP